MPQETTAQLVKELRNARRLFGPDWAKRIAAAQQLGRLQAVEAVGDLAAVLDEQKNTDLCQACVQALGQIGSPQAGDVLARVVDDPDQTDLYDAAVQALLDLLAGPDEQSRRRALEPLLKIDAPLTKMLRPFLTNWQEKDTCPRMLTIDPAGEADFEKLADAVAGAAPMAIIRMVAGDHRLDSLLFVASPVAIFGEGMERTRLLCSEPLILVGDGPILVHGTSIEYGGGKNADVVTVHTADAYLRECRFSGGVGSRTKDGIGGRGLVLISSTKCVVAHCTFEQNAVGAVLIDQYAKPILEDNTCQGQTYAIAYSGNAAGDARRNQCHTNAEGIGIVLTESAQPALENNVCEHNSFGVQYRHSASGTARENQCKSNSVAGIAVQDGSSPLLETNLCSANQDHGISICDSAHPTLTGNKCQDNGSAGIFYFDSASGTAKSNLCQGNDAGIVIDDSAGPELVANVCQQNQRSGIVYIGHSRGIAKGNQCNNNGEIGILVLDQAYPTLQQNTCKGNFVGCTVQAFSRAVVKADNDFRGNRQAGLIDERQ